MNPVLNIIVPKEIKEATINFVYNPENYIYFQANTTRGTSNRRFSVLNETQTPFAKLVDDFAKKAYEEIGIINYKEEPILGNFLGVNSAGGNVHQHMDSTLEKNYHHLRINIMIQKPLEGGMPVIDDVEYEIEENKA